MTNDLLSIFLFLDGGLHLTVAKVLALALLAILFLQSGLDKIFNWGGNLSWLKDHFSKSPLSGVVPLMLGVITLAETAAGALCGAGIAELLFMESNSLGMWGTELSALSLVMLFFGQRLAQDYPGAASLVPYFILTIITMFLLG